MNNSNQIKEDEKEHEKDFDDDKSVAKISVPQSPAKSEEPEKSLKSISIKKV